MQNIHRYFFYAGLVFNTLLDHRRGRGLPRTGTRLGRERRHHRALRQRRAALDVLAQLPRLSPPRRRPGQEFQGPPDPLPILEDPDAAQRQAHELRVGLAALRRLHRHLRAPRRLRRASPTTSSSRRTTSDRLPLRTPRLRRTDHRRRRRRTARRDRGASSAASRSASSPSRCSARPTPSWPRAAWPRRWATSIPRTTGWCTFATPCAAASTSTTTAWPNSTPRSRRTASGSSSSGGRSSTAPRTARSSSATSAVTATRASPTSATAPAWS